MEQKLSNYKLSEVHCIEFIGKHQDSNVTKLAEAFFMTRGAISKVTQKLLKKGTIESYKKSDNKKEIYFRLTEKGKKVYDIHEKLHQEIEQRDQLMYSDVTEEQYAYILLFKKNTMII